MYLSPAAEAADNIADVDPKIDDTAANDDVAFDASVAMLIAVGDLDWIGDPPDLMGSLCFELFVVFSSKIVIGITVIYFFFFFFFSPAALSRNIS